MRPGSRPPLNPPAPTFAAGHLAQGGALQAPREHNLRSAGQAGKAARAFLKVTPPELAWGRPPTRK
jgi:hypothetical protein